MHLFCPEQWTNSGSLSSLVYIQPTKSVIFQGWQALMRQMTMICPVAIWKTCDPCLYLTDPGSQILMKKKIIIPGYSMETIHAWSPRQSNVVVLLWTCQSTETSVKQHITQHLYLQIVMDTVLGAMPSFYKSF